MQHLVELLHARSLYLVLDFCQAQQPTLEVAKNTTLRLTFLIFVFFLVFCRLVLFKVAIDLCLCYRCINLRMLAAQVAAEVE